MHARESECFRLTCRFAGKSETVEFDQARVLVGRGPECDLRTGGPDVSRKHTVIERSGDGWAAVDLNSRHGTFVNGRQITTRRLEEGDRISLGPPETASARLLFHAAPEPPEPEGRVLFEDRQHSTSVRMSIHVEDFERMAAGRSPASEPPTGEPATIRTGPETSAARFPVVGMFKELSEALLTSKTLEEMLVQVVRLAVAHVSAERGFICLCDEKADTLAPKVTFARGLAEGESFTISQSIAREAVRARQALLVTDAVADSRFAEARSVVTEGIRSAICAPLYHAGKVQGLIYVDTLYGPEHFTAADLELLVALSALTAVGIEQARLRDDVDRERMIRARLSRYSSPHVVEQIANSPYAVDGEMHAEQREVTVLFADLHHFTTMVEGAEPAAVARVLNSVFEHLTRAVFQYDGTLDKFLGDGLLAVFGAPLPAPDHAERAVRAALMMHELLEKSGIAGPRGESLQMRIGIESGTAVAGDIGSPIRKDYTVVGDAVNVASRLESSVARPGQTVIGPATCDLCRQAFECEPLAEIQLKGKKRVLRPSVVLGPKQAATQS